MGLPGSGKTYLTERLVPLINAAWYNADKVREMSNDWDFSISGRNRQAKRMTNYANFEINNNRSVICDFIAPTNLSRKIFNANYIIWMDTIKNSLYEDTNKLFEIPKKYDLRIYNFDYDIKIPSIYVSMLN